MRPGAATPPHRHDCDDCDEAVLCLGGSGELRVAGQVHVFGPNSALVLPKGTPHQIVNTGDAPLATLGHFAATPVPTYLPDGQPLELPWRA